MCEWYQSHLEDMLLRDKVYRHENRDSISCRRRERYWAVPAIRERHLERNRQYSRTRKRNLFTVAEMDAREMVKDAQAQN